MSDQPLLLEVAPTAPAAQLPAAPKEYTGANFFEKNPEAYAQIVLHLADGVGLLKIARLVSCSVHTVIAVRDREGPKVAILKERIAHLARTAGQLALEAIVDDISDPITRAMISTKDLAIIAGVTIEKGELMSGGATVRVEVVVPRPAGEDFTRYLDEIQKVYEVGPVETGSAPATKGPALLVSPDPAGQADPAGAPGPASALTIDLDVSTMAPQSNPIESRVP